MITLPTKCCCCVTLENGGKALGWIGIVNSSIQVITLSVSCVASKVDLGICAGAIISHLIFLIASIFLLVGISEKRLSYLRPWLIAVFLIILSTVVALFYGIFSGYPDFLYLLIPIGIMTYFWIVIFSLYKSIQQAIQQDPESVPIESS